MVIDYKNGNVEVVGTVFRDAETKMAGNMEIATATIAEHSYKGEDGRHHAVCETITGKFATLKMVSGLRKDDIVRVKGIRETHTYTSRDGVEKTRKEIVAQWVDVWGGTQQPMREPGEEEPLPFADPINDEEMPF